MTVAVFAESSVLLPVSACFCQVLMPHASSLMAWWQFGPPTSFLEDTGHAGGRVTFCTPLRWLRDIVAVLSPVAQTV